MNDQRHRWVTSGVFQSSPPSAGDSFFQKFMSNWTFAPLLDIGSGRPFNVITGTDTRLDLGASEIRPNLGGTTVDPYIPGVTFGVTQVCLTDSKQPYTVPGITPPNGCTGNLGRNAFRMPPFYQFDMRLSKGLNLGERFRVDLMMDIFNVFNHTNVIAVNQLCDPTAGPVCTAGAPTAAADARQLQFALRFSW